MRILSPLKSPIALIFFRNHPPICGKFEKTGRGTRLKGAYASSMSFPPSPWWYQAAMPSGFIPNGMVQNHSIPGSRSFQYCAVPMYASILPWDAASKHSKGCMICPPGNTSIRNRPPLISSTAFASRWTAPWS